MAYPVRDFLPSRRLVMAGAAATFISAATARAEISSALIKGSMKRFKLTTPPKPVPDLEFLDANNQPISLSELNGQARLINLWATWCAPCVKEMPSLDRLQAEMPRDRFLVIPISLDGPSKPKVAPFYADKKLANLGIYFDKGKKVLGALDISVLPTSVLVDAEGREIGRMEGDADWDKPEALALMKAAIPTG